jgi:hypothetical protein
MDMVFKNKPAFKEIDSVKLMYNVGALLDIPTGKYILGIHGESILNGGLGVLTAIAGRGNTYKSTIAHYMMFSAANAVAASGYSPYMSLYDTEMSISPDRLKDLSSRFDHFKDTDIIADKLLSITDKTMHMGNEWYEILKTFLKGDKLKNKKDYMIATPFTDPEGKIINTVFPTFGEIDSISEFETADIQEIQNKNELGDSGGNTIHMRLGLAKTRLLMELPSLCNSSGHYMLMTAHLGTDMNIGGGPHSMPTKKLQHMKMGDKIKGVTDKFFFLPNLFWQTLGLIPLTNKDTKGPEFPKVPAAGETENNDLNLVTVRQLRNKSGPSGVNIDIIVSQTEGVLPSLTEFYYLKENGRFGLEGSNVSYSLALLPDVKLSRTTVRQAIDTNPLLRRAIKITADLLQMKQLWRHLDLNIPEPKELYDKLKETYDWNVLLDTRDWWTFKNDTADKNFLSTMDLVNMYHGRYIPFWMKDTAKPATAKAKKKD